jgi:hypothetical protein
MPKIDFSRIPDTSETIINGIFEEIGLVLGGLVALHMTTRDPEEDDFLWRLCKNLDVIRVKSLKKLSPPKSGKKLDLRPHPAIAELVHRSRRFL